MICGALTLPALGTAAGAGASVSELRRQAELQVSSGAIAEALSAYRQALSLDPTGYGLLYEIGTLERKNSNPAGSKDAFLRLLKLYPESGDGFEGLSLACLSLGEYREAAGYLEQWNVKSPNSAYVLGLLARAYSRAGLYHKASQTYTQIVGVEPKNITARRKLNDLRQTYDPGIFPMAKSYRSVGPEGLNTTDPQRIVYEGRSAEATARVGIGESWNILTRASIGEEAQRNQTKKFTYYDILEKTGQLGAEGKLSRVRWQALGGWSRLSDTQELGVGDATVARWNASAEWPLGESELSLKTSQSPKFLRGAGGDRFFTILRERSASAGVNTHFWDTNWRLGASVDDYSEGTRWLGYSALGIYETGINVFQPSYSRSRQEFFGATAEGRIGFVNADRLSLRWRRWRENEHRLIASYAFGRYSDSNYLQEWNAELSRWLMADRGLELSYRFSRLDYRQPLPGYRNTDEQSHRAGLSWQKNLGAGAWSTLAWEHGLLWDESRGQYQADSWSGRLDWYLQDRVALSLHGNAGESTVDDHSYSARLEGRWSF